MLRGTAGAGRGGLLVPMHPCQVAAAIGERWCRAAGYNGQWQWLAQALARLYMGE